MGPPRRSKGAQCSVAALRQGIARAEAEAQAAMQRAQRQRALLVKKARAQKVKRAPALARRQVRALLRRLQAAEAEKRSAAATVAERDAQLGEARTRELAREGHLQSAESRAAALESELERQRQELQDTRGQLAGAQQALQQRQQGAKTKSQLRADTLQRELSKARAAIEQLGEDRAVRDARIRELEEQLQKRGAGEGEAAPSAATLSEDGDGAFSEAPRCGQLDAFDDPLMLRATQTRFKRPKEEADRLGQQQQLYRSALDEQLKDRLHQDGAPLQQESARRARGREPSEEGGFFRFGRPGSGAPVRDSRGTVITDLRYARRTSSAPVH
eukprot:TRINITY_DN25728_c0_g1_i1.p1 TRINITY_DN25728_c0_g1~~TRINITY_DN25728_c0_g1_i1.p1  ORF type:complete len:361 (+),score=120.58 TRINITY_DN25728_c0_g1_i1:95-1084(+)